MDSQDDEIIRKIQGGIEAEVAETPEYYEFEVHRSEREGEVWKIRVDLTDKIKRVG